MTKNLEYSLDLTSATKGSYVIKPQDDEGTRAERRGSAPGAVSDAGAAKSQVRYFSCFF